MKKVIIILMGIAMSITSANAQDKTTGKLQFETDMHDFGAIQEGPDAAYDFVLTNTGKTPVIIKNATAGCGCTVAHWPTQPILPGKSDKMHVTYHTSGRVGPFVKDIAILSDAEQAQTFVHIKGTVKSSTTAVAATVPAN